MFDDNYMLWLMWWGNKYDKIKNDHIINITKYNDDSIIFMQFVI